MSLAIKITAIILIPIVLGCAPKHDIKTQTVSGTYSGLTRDGEPIKLTVEQVEHGFSGQGTVNGEPLAISGVNIWAATGTITYSNGSSSMVRLGLTPGNENLIIESVGQKEIILSSDGTPVVLPSGPFTGNYRTTGEESSLGEATIVQVGSLITGTAEIFDQFTSITGRVTEPNEAVGTITYIDESQVSFEAKLSADGDTVTFFGMGAPITLERF
jgi:hypothetical protein